MTRETSSVTGKPPGPPSGTDPATWETLPDVPLKAILEALLFASEEPVTIADVAGVLGTERTQEIEGAMEELCAGYAENGGGLRVQRLAGGFRITSDPALGVFVREMVRTRNKQRLSRAALETLAVVAYKQPVTAPEIQAIRGVNPSAILGSLLERRLVRILGRKKIVGKPFLYGTTREFLIRFGLNSLDDLPSLQEFEAMLQAEVQEVAAEDPPPGPRHQEIDPMAGIGASFPDQAPAPGAPGEEEV